MNLLTEHAKELLGMPQEWDAYEFEAIGRTVDEREAKLIRVAGAVAPPKTRGKYKGMPNWKKLDPATEKTAYFTPAEHEEWTRQWERKTGKCAECLGRGEKMDGWSAANGTRYKPCDKCGSTGEAPNIESCIYCEAESVGCASADESSLRRLDAYLASQKPSKEKMQ